MDAVASLLHEGFIGRMPREPESEVRLDGDAGVGRSTWKIAPASIGLLFAEDVIGALADRGIPQPTEDHLHQDELGFEDGVSFEFRAPVSVGLLQ